MTVRIHVQIDKSYTELTEELPRVYHILRGDQRESRQRHYTSALGFLRNEMTDKAVVESVTTGHLDLGELMMPSLDSSFRVCVTLALPFPALIRIRGRFHSSIHHFPGRRPVYSTPSLVKSASLSCWALMNASLNRLASARHGVSHARGAQRQGGKAARTLAVGEPDGQRLGLRLPLADVRGRVPDPAPVAADVGGELHVGHDCGRNHQHPVPQSPLRCPGSRFPRTPWQSGGTHRSGSHRLSESCPASSPVWSSCSPCASTTSHPPSPVLSTPGSHDRT